LLFPKLNKSAQKLLRLQVKGESMIEDGILDGDFVVLKKQTRQKRDIVVA